MGLRAARSSSLLIALSEDAHRGHYLHAHKVNAGQWRQVTGVRFEEYRVAMASPIALRSPNHHRRLGRT